MATVTAGCTGVLDGDDSADENGEGENGEDENGEDNGEDNGEGENGEDNGEEDDDPSSMMRIENVSGPMPESVPGTYVLSEDRMVVTFTPDEPLGYGARYQVTLSKEIRSLRATHDGGTLRDEIVYTFQTEPAPPLTLVGHAPSGGTMDVARRTPDETPLAVSLTFSEDVDPETIAGNVRVYHFDGSPIPGNVLANGNEVIFEPALHWDYSTQYSVHIDPEIRSTRGGPMDSGVSFVFDTLDPPGLAISAFQPGADTKEVARTTDLVLTFSEGVKQAQAQGGYITVEDVSGDIPLDITDHLTISVPGDDAPDNVDLIGDDNVVIVSPTDLPFGRWHYSQKLRVTVSEDLESDRATDGSANPTSHHGGQLGQDEVMSLVVENPPPLLLADRSPTSDAASSEAEGVRLDAPIVLLFSEGVDQASLMAGITVESCGEDAGCADPQPITLDSGDFHFTTIDGDETVDLDPDNPEIIGDDVMVTVTPLRGLDPDTEGGPLWRYSEVIRVQLDDGVHSDRATILDGEPQGHLSPVEYSFRAKDPAVLQLVTSIPSGSAEGILLDEPLTLVFSEAVDQDSFLDGFALESCGEDADCASPQEIDLDGAISWNAAGDTVTIEPTRVIDPDTEGGPLWMYSEVIRVSLDASIESIRATGRNGQLGEDTQYSFRAMDPPALLLSSAVPSSECGNASTNAQLIFRLSEDISTEIAGVAASIEVNDITNDPDTNLCPAENITLTDGSGSGHPDGFTCDPGELTESATIQVTLRGTGGSIESRRATSRGGQLELPDEPYVYTFRVEDMQALLVLANLPSDGAMDVHIDTNVQVVFSEKIDPATIGVTFDEPGQVGTSFFLNPGTTGDLDTALPGTYTLGVNGDKVTFEPGEILEYNTSYTYTLTEEICVDKEPDVEGGCLLETFSYTFTTAGPPGLQVISTHPDDGAIGVPVTTEIRITFNNPIVEGSLYSAEGPSAFLTEGHLTADRENAVPLADDAGCGETLCLSDGDRTITFRPEGALDFLQPHTIVATRDLVDVNGDSLDSVYLRSFTTEGFGLIIETSPASIGINDGLFVQFSKDMDIDTIDNRTFFVTFEDRFGQVVRVPGEISFEATPGIGDSDNCSAGDGWDGCDRAIFTPTLHQSDCIASDRPLLYGTTYSVHLSPTIAALDGERLGRNSGFQVSTPMPPQILSIRSEGVLPATSVDDRDPLAQAEDVPVNSSIVVTFAEDMRIGGEHGIDNPANYRLLHGVDEIEGGSVDVPDARTAIFSPPDDLPFGAELRFVVEGRAPGSTREIHTAEGAFLDDDTTVTFRTSEPFTVVMTPPDGANIRELAVTSLVFSRDLHFPSANDETVFAEDGGGNTLTSILATSLDDLRGLVLIPIPVYPEGDSVTVHVRAGIMDEVGNPLPDDVSFHHPFVDGAPASAAMEPQGLNVTPGDGTVIQGDPVFVVEAVNTDLRNRLLPRSFNSVNIFLERLSDEVAIPLRYDFIPGGAAVDRAEIRPIDPLQAGEGYRLFVRRSQIANVYTLAESGAADIVRTYTVEEEAPTVISMEVRTTTGAEDILGGFVASVLPMLPPLDTDTPYLRIAFDEAVRPATVNLATVVVSDSADDQVLGCYDTDGAEVVFTPADPATCGDFYPRRIPLRSTDGPFTVTVSAGGVLDMAGNAIEADAIGSFEIDDEAPTVLSMTPSGDGESLDTLVELEFDKMLDPTSACGPGMTTGHVAIAYDVPAACNPAEVQPQPACCSVDSDTLTTVTMEPLLNVGYPEPVMGLVGSRLYETVASAELTDLAGNELGVEEFETFSTMSGEPIVLCATPEDGEAGVSVATSIETYFSEPLDTLTFQDGFGLHRVEDGEEALCTYSFEEGDTKAICTPDLELDPDTEYEYLIGYGIESDTGVPILGGFDALFLTEP